MRQELSLLKLSQTRLRSAISIFHSSYSNHASSASICPDGCLTTGKGSRFVLVGSEPLHEKIDILTERVRELEAGLAALFNESFALTGQEFIQPHPLLTEVKLKIKSEPVAKKNPRPRPPPEQSANPVVESSEESDEEGPVAKHNGTLKIDERGTSTYFGSTARSEVRSAFCYY